MRMPTWTKVAAAFGTVLTALGVGMGYMSQEDFKEAVKEFDKNKIEHVLSSHVKNEDASQRLHNAMDGEILALFQCGPHIAAKVKGLTSEDGHVILEDKGDHFIRWNTHDQKYERLEKILATIDPKTKTQFCATYSVKHKDLVMHWGGTDFLNPTDMAQATITAGGGISPRARDGVAYTNNVLDILEEKYAVDPDELNTSIVTHSVGAAAEPLSKMALANRGYVVNETVHYDSFGGRKALDVAAETMGVAPALLEQNVNSVKPPTPGLLDNFQEASLTIGERKTIAAENHLGKSFAIAANRKIHHNIQK